MHQCCELSSCDGSPPSKVTQCPAAPPCSGQQVLCSVGLSLTLSRSVFLDSSRPHLAAFLPVRDLLHWLWFQLMVGNGQFSLALSESLVILMKRLVPAKIHWCHCQPNIMALPIGVMRSQEWKRKEMLERMCVVERNCDWYGLISPIVLREDHSLIKSPLNPRLYGWFAFCYLRLTSFYPCLPWHFPSKGLWPQLRNGVRVHVLIAWLWRLDLCELCNSE